MKKPDNVFHHITKCFLLNCQRSIYGLWCKAVICRSHWGIRRQIEGQQSANLYFVNLPEVKQWKLPLAAAIAAANTPKVQFLSNKPAMQHGKETGPGGCPSPLDTPRASHMSWEWRRLMHFSGSIGAGRLMLLSFPHSFVKA